MPTVNEIALGIGQVIGLYGHDGALDDKGDPVKIGLKREEEIPITDKRIVDGFGVVLSGNKLKIAYQSDVKVEESHEAGFEGDISDRIQAVAKFLEKEFKKLTGKTLSLTKEGEVSITFTSTSRVRYFVEAYAWYKIGNVDGESNDFDKEVKKIDDAVRGWLSFADAAKAKNVYINPSDNEKSKTKTPFNK